MQLIQKEFFFIKIGVRYKNYKLVWGLPTMLHRSYRKSEKSIEPVMELYDLSNDPHEKYNIASDNP